MAATTLATDSRVQKWLADYYKEYVRDSGFKPYIGRGSTSIINAKYQLTDGGKSINIPLITRLKGAGVTGSATLEGNEEALGNFNQNIAVEWLRHAVRVAKPEEHWGAFSLLQAGGEQLKVWAAEKLKNDTRLATWSALMWMAGDGQTWQDVLTSRALDVAYQNTTGRRIDVSVVSSPTGAGNRYYNLEISTDNTTWLPIARGRSDNADQSFVTGSIPPMIYYRVTSPGVGGGISSWCELR